MYDNHVLLNLSWLFHLRCLRRGASERPMHVLDLVRENLQDEHSRHLLLFTSNATALEMLFGAKAINAANTRVLIGSQFSEDATELQLIHQINDVRRAMEAGDTLVLVNHFNKSIVPRYFVSHALHFWVGHGYVSVTAAGYGVLRASAHRGRHPQQCLYGE